MITLSDVGVYLPHPDYEHLKGYDALAAIVGAVRDDGTLDVLVLVPGKEPHWQERVAAIAPGAGAGERRHCFVARPPLLAMGARTGDGEADTDRQPALSLVPAAALPAPAEMPQPAPTPAASTGDAAGGPGGAGDDAAAKD